MERMHGLYRYRSRRLEARAGESEDGENFEHRSLEYRKAVPEVIAAQRRTVVELRNTARSPTS